MTQFPLRRIPVNGRFLPGRMARDGFFQRDAVQSGDSNGASPRQREAHNASIARSFSARDIRSTVCVFMGRA
jgi:hypothetical protein